ncbi:MAG: hypothetical protein H6Q73_1265 [Firmicutes bacterium]|nr:hypothetical protein [Bacillota bacterium]
MDRYEGCGHYCKPKCMRRCVGEIKYKIYEDCCYHVVRVCSYCGHEYKHHHHDYCPRCGMPHHEMV